MPEFLISIFKTWTASETLCIAFLRFSKSSSFLRSPSFGRGMVFSSRSRTGGSYFKDSPYDRSLFLAIKFSQETLGGGKRASVACQKPANRLLLPRGLLKLTTSITMRFLIILVVFDVWRAPLVSSFVGGTPLSRLEDVVITTHVTHCSPFTHCWWKCRNSARGWSADWVVCCLIFLMRHSVQAQLQV